MSRLNSPKKNSSGAKQCDWHCTFLCIKNLKLVFFFAKSRSVGDLRVSRGHCYSFSPKSTVPVSIAVISLKVHHLCSKQISLMWPQLLYYFHSRV